MGYTHALLRGTFSNKNVKIWYLLPFLLLIFEKIAAQSNSKKEQYYLVDTRDGSRIIGKLIEKKGTTFTLETRKLGKVSFNVNDMKRVVEIDPKRIKSDGYWFENPFAAHSFIAPTGFGLKAGELNYQNTLGTLSYFNYGVTDYFSVGGGLNAAEFFSDGKFMTYYLTTKFSFKLNDDLRLGGGLYGGSFGLIDELSGMVAAVAVGTYGSADNNVTLGVGYGYANGKLASYPIVNLGFQKRIFKNFSLAADLFGIPVSNQFMVFAGVKYINERVSLSIGYVGLSRSSTLTSYPFASVIIPFQLGQ